MLVLHGAWMAAQGTHPAPFALCDHLPPHQRGQAPAAAARPHPFAAPADQDQAVLGALSSLDEQAVVARRPTADGRPLSSPDLELPKPPADEPPRLDPWRVPALRYDPLAAGTHLPALAGAELSPGTRLGADLRCWITATQLALELVYRQRLLPTLTREGAGYAARWRLLLDEDADAARVQALVTALPPAGRALAWTATAPEPGPRTLLLDYLHAVADAVARTAPPLPSSDRKRERNMQNGADSGFRVARAWLTALRGNPVVDADPQELAAFAQAYQAWATPLGATTDSFRVCFRLTPPPPDATETGVVIPKGQAADWTLDYLMHHPGFRLRARAGAAAARQRFRRARAGAGHQTCRACQTRQQQGTETDPPRHLRPRHAGGL